jgi:hypothetical protein
MSQVFISYRHTNPDQELARFLVDFLERRGIGVFVDTRIQVGAKWVKEIDRQLRNSDFLVVLLSKESIRSDMVRQEVKLAHEIGDTVRILPIRVAFEGALPYDLGAYLEPIQYAIWRSDADDQSIAEQIFNAISSSAALPHEGQAADAKASATSLRSLADATENSGAPLPAADPRLMSETGAMTIGSPFYISRTADKQIENQLGQAGQTIIVKGMRQMGKSSLLARAIAEAKKQHYRTLYFDFQRLGPEQLQSLDSLLRYIAQRWARDFKIDVKPDSVRYGRLSAQDNLTYFVQDAILDGSKPPVVLFLDEADQVFGYPYRDQFFALMRAWHNSRAFDERWMRLSLVIAHSTEPHLWIQDINQSPFNVGFPIRLDDFDDGQVSELNDRHGRPLATTSDIWELMGLIGGQPYLVRQALFALVDSKMTLAHLKEVAANESGPFGDHLRRHIWSLAKDKGLKGALRKVLSGKQCSDEKHFQRLSAAGLILGETRAAAKIRCQLYAKYFKDH